MWLSWLEAIDKVRLRCRRDGTWGNLRFASLESLLVSNEKKEKLRAEPSYLSSVGGRLQIPGSGLGAPVLCCIQVRYVRPTQSKSPIVASLAAISTCPGNAALTCPAPFLGLSCCFNFLEAHHGTVPTRGTLRQPAEPPPRMFAARLSVRTGGSLLPARPNPCSPPDFFTLHVPPSPHRGSASRHLTGGHIRSHGSKQVSVASAGWVSRGFDLKFRGSTLDASLVTAAARLVGPWLPFFFFFFFPCPALAGSEESPANQSGASRGVTFTPDKRRKEVCLITCIDSSPLSIPIRSPCFS